MQHYDTNPNKTGGIESDKPATVLTADGREIEVNHHIINDEAGVLHAYLGARSDGIDISIPLTSVRAIVRSARGAEVLGIDKVESTGEEAEKRLVTDGGREPIGTGRADHVEIFAGDEIYRHGSNLGTIDRVIADGNAVEIDPAGDDVTLFTAWPFDDLTLNQIATCAIDTCERCGELIIRERDGPQSAEARDCWREECMDATRRDDSDDGESGGQMRIDDYGGRRLMTDGGVAGNGGGA